MRVSLLKAVSLLFISDYYAVAATPNQIVIDIYNTFYVQKLKEEKKMIGMDLIVFFEFKFVFSHGCFGISLFFLECTSRVH